eukprot:1048560_1
MKYKKHSKHSNLMNATHSNELPMRNIPTNGATKSMPAINAIHSVKSLNDGNKNRMVRVSILRFHIDDPTHTKCDPLQFVPMMYKRMNFESVKQVTHEPNDQ